MVDVAPANHHGAAVVNAEVIRDFLILPDIKYRGVTALAYLQSADLMLQQQGGAPPYVAARIPSSAVSFSLRTARVITIPIFSVLQVPGLQSVAECKRESVLQHAARQSSIEIGGQAEGGGGSVAAVHGYGHAVHARVVDIAEVVGRRGANLSCQ